MSETITEAAHWRFINRTRYNSEDIAALATMWFQVVGEALSAAGVAPVTFTRRDGGENDVMEISDYTPAKVWETRRDGTKHANFVRSPGYGASTRWKIGLVTPDRLYSSPLEALTASTTETPTAPEEFVVQTAYMVRQLFRVDAGYGHWRVESEAATNFEQWVKTSKSVIRIEAARQNPATSTNRKSRTARTSAATATGGLVDALVDTHSRMRIVQSKFNSVAVASNSLKLPLPVTYEEIKQLEEQIASVLGRVKAHRGRLMAP